MLGNGFRKVKRAWGLSLLLLLAHPSQAKLYQMNDFSTGNWYREGNWIVSGVTIQSPGIATPGGCRNRHQ